MNNAQTLEAPAAGPGIAPRDHNLPDGEELLLMVSRDPSLPLVDEVIRDQLFAELQTLVAGHQPNTATEAGRKEITRLNRTLAGYKNSVDEAGKEMNSGLRAEINALDAKRRIVKERIGELQAAVTAPLDAWKAAEEERSRKVEQIMSTIRQATDGIHALPSSAIEARIAALTKLHFDNAVFTEGTIAADDARADAIRQLHEAKAVAEQREADQAELQRLRDQQAAAERAEQERIAQELAKAEAERAAQAAADEARRQADADAAEKIRLANERAEEAERRAQLEREAAAEREREEAERQRKAEQEAAARARDQAHRTKVSGESAAALVAMGIAERKAGDIIVAIEAGRIPHVSITF